MNGNRLHASHGICIKFSRWINNYNGIHHVCFSTSTKTVFQEILISLPSWTFHTGALRRWTKHSLFDLQFREKIPFKLCTMFAHYFPIYFNKSKHLQFWYHFCRSKPSLLMFKWKYHSRGIDWRKLFNFIFELAVFKHSHTHSVTVTLKLIFRPKTIFPTKIIIVGKMENALKQPILLNRIYEKIFKRAKTLQIWWLR